MTDFLIDIQKLPAGNRSIFINKTFQNLALGETLTLVNDCDPLPSLLQDGNSTGGDFEYEYLEKGPDRWAIQLKKISKQGCCGCCGT
ncbi:MAG: DUF2249 domain-containing protein [Pseudobdellovibrionaceae bacterium]